MKTRHLSVWMLAGAAVILLGAGAAMAQTTTTLAPPTSTNAPPGSKGASRQALADGFLQHLADRLGIPKDKLTQATKDAAKDTIDDAASQGLIDADRANALKAAIDAGTGAGKFGFGPRFELGRGKGFHGEGGERGFVKGRDGEVITATANALGLSPADFLTALKDDLKAGKTLDDLAREKGKDPAVVRQAAREAFRHQLQPAVDSGKLTAERADQLADRFAQEFGTRGPRGHHN